MTHLRIEQNTIPENVTSDVIHKLYETAKAIIDAEEANDVQESQVSLKGNLQVSKAYGDEIDWLEAKFPDLHITASARYIKFADPVVERICATNWGDGIGVTMSQLQAVSNIGTAFRGNTSITTFNEFQYFTGVIHSTVNWSTGDWFNGCTNLREITIPKNVVRLYGDNDAFRNCTSLQHVYYDSPSSLINTPGFYNCSSLQSPLIFPNSVTNIRSNFIRDDNNNQGTISNIHTVVFGSQVAYIEPTSSGRGQSTDLDFIIYTTTPPSLSNTWWTNNRITFYVPDSAVSDYKAAEKWSYIAQYIKPVSEYTGSEWDTSLASSMYGYNPS